MIINHLRFLWFRSKESDWILTRCEEAPDYPHDIEIAPQVFKTCPFVFCLFLFEFKIILYLIIHYALLYFHFQLLKLRLVRDRIFGQAERPSTNVEAPNTGLETSENLSRPQGRMRGAIDGTGGDIDGTGGVIDGTGGDIAGTGGDIDGTGGVRVAFSKTTKVSGRSDLREARACTIRWEKERKLDKHLLHTERRQCFRRRRKTWRAISCSLWMLGNIARQKSSIKYRKAPHSWVIRSIIHINP